MSGPQVETRILDGDGDSVTVYAAGCGGVWLSMDVLQSGLAFPVSLHAPFAIADTDEHSQFEFVTSGEPSPICQVLTCDCWTVDHTGYHGAAELLPGTGKPGEVDFDVTVLAALSELARKAPEDAEELRVGWRVRFARRVVRWAVAR